MNGRMTEARRQHYGSFIEEVAEISTLKSRTADRAEREAENYYRKIYRAIGRMTEARRQHYGSFIEEVAEISTLKSRTADRAEREAENYYRKIYRAIQESYLMR